MGVEAPIDLGVVVCEALDEVHVVVCQSGARLDPQLQGGGQGRGEWGSGTTGGRMWEAVAGGRRGHALERCRGKGEGEANMSQGKRREHRKRGKGKENKAKGGQQGEGRRTRQEGRLKATGEWTTDGRMMPLPDPTLGPHRVEPSKDSREEEEEERPRPDGLLLELKRRRVLPDQHRVRIVSPARSGASPRPTPERKGQPTGPSRETQQREREGNAARGRGRGGGAAAAGGRGGGAMGAGKRQGHGGRHGFRAGAAKRAQEASRGCGSVLCLPGGPTVCRSLPDGDVQRQLIAGGSEFGALPAG